MPAPRQTFRDKFMLRFRSARRVDGMGLTPMSKPTPSSPYAALWRNSGASSSTIYDGVIISSKIFCGCGCAIGTGGSRTIAILRAYEPDERFVLADTTLGRDHCCDQHDTFYARIWRGGIGYDEHLCHRVEAVRLRCKLAFVCKLIRGTFGPCQHSRGSAHDGIGDRRLLRYQSSSWSRKE